ncbi:MAG: lysylphosphatidylglycerol synthase transmembrane domain-containing protein [Oscillospiraceae bacterium]
MKDKIINFLKNGGLFCLLVALTACALFKNNDIYEIVSVIRNVKLPFLFVGVGAMVLFILCDAKNTQSALGMFGDRISYLQCLRYAVVGFFFSSITPSASGGQPMQIYYMHKDNIPISHSGLTLMTELAAFQLVAVSYALIGFFMRYQLLVRSVGPIYFLLVLGILCNTCVLILILLAIFSKKTAPAILDGVTLILRMFKYKNVDAFELSSSCQLLEYRKCAQSFKDNKKVVLKILLTTCLQIGALHSVSYWVYLAFGLDTYSFFTVLCLQSILFISVSAIPLPGTVGISESGFMVLFRALFSPNALAGAMLLSRGISFYLFVLITGAIISFDIAIKKVRSGFFASSPFRA